MNGASGKVEIEEVSGKTGRRRFVEFQFDLYRNEALWVPPIIADELAALDAEKNPGLEDCQLRLWLAMRDGKCVGRVAGLINPRENSRRGIAAARFSLIDFIDDLDVVRRLIGTVESWARESGVERLEGPLGLTTFERSAVLVDGFDFLPTAVSSYNFSYYAGHLESAGMRKEIDYVEHHFAVMGELDPKYEKVASYVLKKKGLHLVEKRSRRTLRPLAGPIFDLINRAYDGLYEFTPMREREVDALIKKFFSFIDPRFVKLVADADGDLVAVGVAMPSLSRGLQAAGGRLWPFGFIRLLRALKREDTLDLYLVAVRPELRNAGLTAILMREMHREAVAAGMRWVETNGELETNTRVISMWRGIEYKTHKRRRIYRKPIA